MSGKNIYEPCSCGSGKKFKFCCLQKAKGIMDLPNSELLKKALEFPFYQCWVNQGWENTGIACVMLIRVMPSQKYFFAGYNIDTFCLGLKEVATHFRVRYDDIAYIIRTFPGKMVEISYEDSRSIVLGGIEYAAKFGFAPHEDWELSKYAIEAQRDYDKKFTFGKDGKPYYIQGPHDDVNKIMKKLHSFVEVGEADFTILA